MTLDYESGNHVDSLDNVVTTIGRVVFVLSFFTCKLGLLTLFHRIVADLGTGIKGGDFVLSSHRVLLQMKLGMA